MRPLAPILPGLLATAAALQQFATGPPDRAPGRSPQPYQFATRPRRHPQHRRLDVWEDRVLPSMPRSFSSSNNDTRAVVG